MAKILYHLKSAERREILQLLSILGMSVMAAGLGYTAVSWISQIENRLLIGLMAVGVTLIFCGVLILLKGIITLQTPRSDQQSASASPKRSAVQMGLSSE
ncbi:MAG: hypothetical protein AAF490_06110 [Chloroflexota bacterium]